MNGLSKSNKDIKEKSRRQYLVVEAIDPISGKTCNVMISYDRLQQVCRRSIGQIMEAGDLVPSVLKRPSAVFEGLCSDKDEPKHRGYGWRCYCAVPLYAYNDKGRRICAWRNKVFLVFVNDESVAYLWYWSKCDPEQANLPEDHTSRFRRKVL